MNRFRVILLGLILAGSLVGLWAVRTGGQTIVNLLDTPINVYSVKFLCGEFDRLHQRERAGLEGPVKPGNYQTAINIHNPNLTPVRFAKKAILMFSEDPAFQQGFEVPRKPGDFVTAALEPNWGMEIDCADIRQVLLKGSVPPPPPAPSFIKGWVVIEIPGGRETLDIETAYTAHGFGDVQFGPPAPEGFSLEIERATLTRAR